MRKRGVFMVLWTLGVHFSLLALKPGEIIDLSGAWIMKDFPLGKGISQKLYLPENWPSDGIVCPVPGTVRNALLLAGQIPNPYFGYDNEKSLWVEEREWWFYRKFVLDPVKEEQWVDLIFEGTSFQGRV